jgi:hypothetical protein
MRNTKTNNNNNNLNNNNSNQNRTNITKKRRNNNNNTNNNNNRKKIRNRNQIIRNLRQRLSTMVLEKQMFSNDTPWYHTRQPGLYRQVNSYHDNALAEYVYGLFHPDAVYRENLNIKAPSVLPIPTTNFAFKETFTLQPNIYGNFVLVWSPNYLGSMDRIPEVMKHKQINGINANGYFSNVYYDVNETLDGNSMATSFQAQTFKHINQQFNKYRLTSACIKVKYTGKVLNQSGMMSACASFMEFPRTAVCVANNTTMSSTYAVPNEFPQLQRLGDFDTIRQGQWTKTINIVDEPSGITCVYIPTDTLSQAFVDNADTLTAKTITDFYPQEPANAIGTYWYSRNANITFDICGYGITTENQTNCITVECYYNYEIIVNEDQLSFFRPTTARIETKQAEDIQRMTQKVASTVGTITETRSHESPSTMSKIATAIRQGLQYAEPYLPLLKLGTMLL